MEPTHIASESRTHSEQRWRVVLVRVAPEARGPVQAVLPGARTLDLTELPVVIRTTGSRNKAHKTANRLRSAGAVVLVIEEPMEGDGAFCLDHPDRVAARVCMGCGRPTCTSCRDLARGEDVCVACRRKGLTPRARTRRRSNPRARRPLAAPHRQLRPDEARAARRR